MEGFLLLVVVAMVAAAGVLAMDDSDDFYDISIPPDNSLPPSQPPHQSSGLSLYDEPPPLQERNPNYKYGSPHQSPSSSGPSLIYGPPPPPPLSPSSSLKYQQPSSYGSAFSLFDDSCGRWKALSVFLVAGIALVGLALVFGLWSLPLSVSVGEDDTSKLTDPAFTSSVYEQIGDISRILMAIKDTTDNPKHDQGKEVDQGT
ncbi:uncharacterized protein [Panulirus ornatus]|uniref:uncharacterized protein n=1 Tax=Panulirus ornatus TaxID=150431 RepID=UPI003A898981